MRCKAPDKRFYRELTDLNGEFLGLIASHQPAHSVLGLDSAVVRRIRELSDPELDFIAETPCLLAGFTTVSSTRMVGEANLDLADVDRGWVDAARLFTAGLMTYLWQMAGRDSFTAALCVGPERSRMTEFTEMTFSEIQSRARLSVHYLEARLRRHPRFWPDLIRAARSTDGTFRSISRLTAIPMALAEGHPGALNR